MVDAVVTVFFHAVLDEANVDEPTRETKNQALVTPEPIESAPNSGLDAGALSPAKRKVVLPAPSMWN